MAPRIRAFVPEGDTEQVVELALRAWAPVFDSMARVLGPGLSRHVLGADWRDDQEQDVRRACSTHVVSVAVEGGRVLGFTTVDLPEGPQGEIYMLAVDPDHQGRGIGSRLTRAAIEQMREAGKAVAMVGTGGDPGHAPARATYEKAGFTNLPAEQYYLLL